MQLRRITDPAEMLLHKLNPVAVAGNDNRPGAAQMEWLIDAHQQKSKASQQRPANALSPSLLSLDGCDLETWFRFFPAQYPFVDPQPAATRRKWDGAAVMGKALHTAWQNALVDSGIIPQYNVEIKLDDGEAADAEYYGISRYMRLDAMITPSENLDAPIVGLEIKSVAGKDFDPSSRYFPGKLKPDQSQLYMFFYGLDKMHFVVVNRDAPSWFDPSAVMEFELEADQAMQDALLDKAAQLTKRIEEKVMPSPKSPGDYYCKNLCEFSRHCPLWAR